jgi:peptidoglycan-associated lipoprotein
MTVNKEKGVRAMKKSVAGIMLILGAVWFGLSGCVTQSSLQKQVDEALDKRVGEVEMQVEANTQEIASLKNDHLQSLEQKQEETMTLTSDARRLGEEALARAEEVGKVVEGKLLYEVTFTDEAVHFGFDKSALSEEARASLGTFAESIKAANKDVYIEIQGHTDSTGAAEYNLRLGQVRAEKVMRYLYADHGIPLHRLGVFSYGESRPIADNNIIAERAKNRRVTLVVIQ